MSNKNKLIEVFKINTNLKLVFLLFTFQLYSHRSNGQTVTLNKYNSREKKDGYWKVFLDDKLNPADSLNSYFFGFELWDNGKDVFKYHKHQWSFSKITSDKTLPEKGKPQAINGTFKWYSENGRLLNAEIYNEGHPFFIKSYVYENDNIKTPSFNEVLYFDKKYKDIPGTFYYEEYGRNGLLNGRYWFRKGERGWRVYETSESVAVPQTDTLINPPIRIHNDTIIQLPKWPYINGRTPPIIGLLVGYNFYKDPMIEIGTTINLSDNTGNKGVTFGPSLIYKRYINKNINAIDVDFGFYFPLTFGLGANYNFSSTDNMVGFKPFIGTTFAHFQLTYGYNFFSDKKNENLKLSHHCIKLSLTIPLYRIMQL